MMPRFDQPSPSDDPASHVAERRDRETARIKLLALAADLEALDLRHRLMASDRGHIPLLRVWDPHKQHLSETIACHLLSEGWRFTAHPSGPVIADADGIAEPSGAIEAARLASDRIAAARRK